MNSEKTGTSVSDREAANISRFNLALSVVAGIGVLGYLVSAVYAWYQPPENVYFAIEEGNYPVAIDYLHDQAETGDVDALNTLGNLYRFGLGVGQNTDRAARLYYQGARAGKPKAMINLGLMYREGLGVEKAPEFAYAWFNLAREAGNATGQAYMSEMIASLRQIQRQA